jgi:CRISPR-associated endonuclease/helicase Cas3
MNFEDFFRAVHGYKPYLWQSRLAETVMAEGWPSTVDAPTGAGKTAALDVAVYAIVAESLGFANEINPPARRIFFVVDRRIVVDATFARANRIAQAIDENNSLEGVKVALRRRHGLRDGEPALTAHVMRGGMYRDNSWIASPTAPMIGVSTVDQFGSRLLLRGYGVSPKMRPIHAALVATDSLLLVDEAHLSKPFLQTVSQVVEYSKADYQRNPIVRPLTMVQLSATLPSPGNGNGGNTDVPKVTPFALNENERNEKAIRRRLIASKPALLAPPIALGEGRQPLRGFVRAAANAAMGYLKEEVCIRRIVDGKTVPPVIGLMVNRVDTARLLHEELEARVNAESASTKAFDCVLLTGRIRPYDRDRLLFRQPDVQNGLGWLRLLESDRSVSPTRPIFVVSTQTLEVGADLDFDALVTQVAAIDALRQRFGRLDRQGVRGKSPATILATKDDIAARSDDPVYGNAMATTWKLLNARASGKGQSKSVDFGIDAFDQFRSLVNDADYRACLVDSAPTATLTPGHLDLLAQTNPAPDLSPEVAIFLHGTSSKVSDVSVVWRCDLPIHFANQSDTIGELDSSELESCIDTVAMIPPTSLEACSLPIHAVRRWLELPHEDATDATDASVADVDGMRLPDRQRTKGNKRYRQVLRWRGPRSNAQGSGSNFCDASKIRPGDTIVVPSTYGGYDEFGWNSESKIPVEDIADQAACLGRALPILRLHPAVLRQNYERRRTEAGNHERIPEDAVSSWTPSEFMTHVKAKDWVACDLLLQEIAMQLADSSDYRIRSKPPTRAETQSGREPPPVLIARRRLGKDEIFRLIRGVSCREDQTEIQMPHEEGDGVLSAGSRDGRYSCVSLASHTSGVVSMLDRYLTALRLPEPTQHCLRTAAVWHDVGKVDPRFQLWMFGGDEIEQALAGYPLLAKSLVPWWDSVASWAAREKAGVPSGFRHEELSVLLFDQLKTSGSKVDDTNLIRHLIGTHHGCGCPLWPIVIDDNPTSVQYDHLSGVVAATSEFRKSHRLHSINSGWSGNWLSIHSKYGWWQTAFLETVLRISDQQQSSIEANEVEVQQTATGVLA